MAGGTPYPLSAAIKTVKEGLSANEGLRQFRSGGGAIARATWLRTVAEVRANLADSLDEATRPINRKPQPQEITVVTSKTRSDFLQQVDVYVLNRDTGEVETRPFTWRGQALITRKAAVNEALNAFNDGVTGSPDRFNETVLGATYTSTIQLVPRG